MELHPIPCFRSNRYEPYLLLRRCAPTLPPFAEAFTGYGKNKIQHVAHLRFRCVGAGVCVLMGFGFGWAGGGWRQSHTDDNDDPTRLDALLPIPSHPT